MLTHLSFRQHVIVFDNLRKRAELELRTRGLSKTSGSFFNDRQTPR